MDTRSKIIDLEAARKLLAGVGRLVAAGGAFDVLQAGHARFLEGLRRPGTEVLVVVYDDASLERPILPAAARAQLVAALAAVDYVVVCRRGEVEAEQEVPEERNIIGEVLSRRP